MKAAAPVLDVIKDFFRFTADTHPAPSTLHTVSEALGSAIENGQSITKSLDKMAATDDPYGKAVVSAFCTGLGAIADENAPEDAPAPSPLSWHAFLVDEIQRIILRNTPLKTIQDKVAIVTNSVNLAGINPRLAYTYYKQCGGV